VRTYNWDDGTNYHALPISWFWSNIEFVYLNPSQEKASVNYTAIQYLFVWLFYLIVAVPEFIFWIVFLVEDQESCDSTIGFYLFNLWASYFGLYGSWILYSGTVIMPILQLERLKGVPASSASALTQDCVSDCMRPSAICSPGSLPLARTPLFWPRLVPV